MAFGQQQSLISQDFTQAVLASALFGQDSSTQNINNSVADLVSVAVDTKKTENMKRDIELVKLYQELIVEEKAQDQPDQTLIDIWRESIKAVSAIPSF